MKTVTRFLILSLLLSATSVLHAQALRFDFGADPVADGYTAVGAQTLYSDDLGYGFEPGTALTEVLRKKGTDLTRDYITAVEPFWFSVRLPEGSYKVTLTLGDTQGTLQLQRRQVNPRYWIWDGIHPTSAGHQQMADLWISKATQAGWLLTGSDDRVTIPVARQQLEQSPQGPFEATWKPLGRTIAPPNGSCMLSSASSSIGAFIVSQRQEANGIPST